MTRTQQWDTREFHQFLLATAKLPFFWGENDCCLFAANAIQSFTDVDLASDFRGKYTDEASAFALIASVTGGNTAGDAAAWCAAKYGLTPCTTPLMARRGDLVVIQDSTREIAGVVHLNGRQVVSVGEDGLKVMPITAVKRAWHV
jgi:hypothetical protein